MNAIRKNMITAVLVLCFSSSCAAATITLKDGSVIKGEILEKTGSYIKVKTHGVSIPYFYSEIKEVGEDSSPGSGSGRAQTTEGNSLPGGYVNNEYGVSIIWPKGWDVFQRPVSEEVKGVRIYVKRKSDDTIPYIVMHISRNQPEKILSMVENIAGSRKETGEVVILSVPPRDCVMNGMPAKQWVLDFPAVHSSPGSSALKSRVSSPGARELLKGARNEAFMFIKNGVVVILESILHNDERLEKEREEVLSAVNNFKFLK